MRDFLGNLARASARRARAARRRESEPEVRRRAREAPPAVPLRVEGFDLLAEVKPRSPAGATLPGVEVTASFVAKRAVAYAEAGAAAVSVLTEPSVFGGCLEHLEPAARAVPVPVMRKDFLVDPYQVFEARAARASGILLVARLLDGARLGEMLDAAAEAGVFVLAEAFDAEDARRVGVAIEDREDPPVLCGVNARNLCDLSVDAGRFAALAALLPRGVVRVAESGLLRPADTARVARLGYSAALVGTALMRARDPRRLARDMIVAGRAAREAHRCEFA